MFGVISINTYMLKIWLVTRTILLLPINAVFHNQHLFAQTKRWKPQNNVWNVLKVSNKGIRTTSLTSFWCFCSELWTDFAHCSDVSIVDFKQVNLGFVYGGLLNADVIIKNFCASILKWNKGVLRSVYQ